MRLGGRGVLRRSARPSEWTIRTHLLSISVVVVALVIGVSVLTSARAQSREADRARESAELYAGLVAEDRADSGVSDVLEPLAENPDLGGADPQACAATLSSLAAFSRFGHADVVEPDGTIVCTSHPDGLEPGTSHAGAPWLEAAEPGRAGPFGPYRDPITDAWTVVDVVPLDGSARLVAAVLDLGSQAAGLGSGIPDPDGMELLVLDPERSQVVLHRLPGSPQDGDTSMVGTSVAGTDLGAVEPDRAIGLDGVARYYSSAAIPDGSGYVLVGIPVTAAEDAGRSAAISSLQVGVLMLLALLLLTVALNRRLVRPIEALIAAIRRMAAGDPEARAPVHGPAELAEVATEFNRMAEMRAVAEAELAHQALHDRLTGLPNRALVLDRLEQSLAVSARRGSEVGVIFLDIDNFKVINDSLGHGSGDALLVALSQRLLEAVRPGDTVARFGGDEFIVLCAEVHGMTELARIAERLQLAMGDPLSTNDGTAVVTLSMGLATSAGGTTAEALLRDADAAMYRAKERGRDRIELFDESVRRDAIERLTTEADLRHALINGDLVLHYQPIIALRGAGSVVAAEALVRWQHPERGLVGPDSFIPVAEQTGLIHALGAWVLRSACEQAVQWRRSLGEDAPGVSVNVSAHQLDRGDLAHVVEDALAASGLPPERLCLEITESGLMRDIEANARTLAEIRALGVILSIDDFGTGHSSFGYLRRLPVHQVKIDRSFVADLDLEHQGPVIIAAIIELAHALGLDVVAEGVETLRQHQHLSTLGCDRAQGFLFSRPRPPDKALELAALDLDLSRPVPRPRSQTTAIASQ
jgi:diguanylate cyclase (GGDEF)-like protein